MVVPAARGPALPDEPLEVRQRLGDGETALRRRQLPPEDVERDLVGGSRGSPSSAASVSSSRSRWCSISSRARAAGVVDRLPVPGVDDARRELDRPRERGEVVAERVGPALRVETDRRRDPVAAGDRRRSARRHGGSRDGRRRGRAARATCQPSSSLALVEQLRFDGVADERRERVPLLDQVVRDRRRHAVPHEPVGDPLGPVVAPPDALALRVVEARPGRPALPVASSRGLRTADVVGMEVRDRRCARPSTVAPTARLAEPEARVEERARRAR